MGRLIDADELGFELKISPNGYLYVTDDDIINAPTIDAKPVRHGHWEWNGHCYDYECSCCHRGQDNKSDYCPDCGARMDEQEESK